MIILKSLAQTMSNLATGSLEIKNKLTVMKNFEKLADLMKVVTTKTKEYTYAWGIDGQLQQGNVKLLDKLQARKRGSAIAEAAADAEKLHENLIGLVRQGYKTGDMQPVEDLITIFHFILSFLEMLLLFSHKLVFSHVMHIDYLLVRLFNHDIQIGEIVTKLDVGLLSFEILQAVL